MYKYKIAQGVAGVDPTQGQGEVVGTQEQVTQTTEQQQDPMQAQQPAGGGLEQTTLELVKAGGRYDPEAVGAALNDAAERLGNPIENIPVPELNTLKESIGKTIAETYGVPNPFLAELQAAGVPVTANEHYDRRKSGSREIIYSLNNKYTHAGLDLMQALRVWKQAKLTPEMIRDQVRNDIGRSISSAEARVLHRTGSDLVSGMRELDFRREEDADVLEKMGMVRKIKLTPNVRASVERVGQNLFRTKRANILWKIDMMNTDDGKQVPYLVRIDTTTANEETEHVKEGL